MKVTELERDGERLVIQVEVEKDEVGREFSRMCKRYKKELIVPGFRKGRAPDGLVKRKFGDKVAQDVEESLLKTFGLLAMDELNVHLVDSPKAEPEDLPEENKPFRFRMSIRANVIPRIGGYERLEIELPPKHVVTEDDVENTLERLRKRFAILKPVENAEAEVSIGDRVTVDVAFLGLEDAEVIMSAPNETLDVLSAETVLYGQKVLGAKPNEEMLIDFTVPDDFADEGTRGREVKLSIAVREIKRVHLPLKDDSFAKMVGETDTLDGLRNVLRERLTEEHENDYNRRREDAMFSKLLDLNPIEVHPQILHSRIGKTVAGMVQRGIISRNIPDEDLMKVADSVRPVVLDTIRQEMLTQQIALQENMDASDKEVSALIKATGAKPSVGAESLDYLVELHRVRSAVRRTIIESKVKSLLVGRLEIDEMAGSEQLPEEHSNDNDDDNGR